MSLDLKIILVEDDDTVRGALQTFLDEQEAYKDICATMTSQEAQSNPQAYKIVLDQNADQSADQAARMTTLPKPVRLGAVQDAIERIIKRSKTDGRVQFLEIGPWKLDTLYHSLENRKNPSLKSVRLTEKETSILTMLYEHTGQSVSRDMLLEHVWDYAEGVETHTVIA